MLQYIQSKKSPKRGAKMKNTSLCYIEKDGAYLMIHRIKKKNDENHDKWIGVGGKFEYGESPFDCARREIFEECGVRVLDLNYRGIVTFVSEEYGTEYMHLFTAKDYEGEIDYNCNEGVLEWVKKENIPALPIWEGDKIFFKLLDTETRFFSLKLEYKKDRLINSLLEF